jgi:hypothetical protein
MNASVLIGFLGLAVSIATFFIGRVSAHRAEGERSGYLASDIGYIKAGIDDLKTEVRTIKVEMSEFSTRLTRVEERVNNAHDRIDELIQKGV